MARKSSRKKLTDTLEAIRQSGATKARVTIGDISVEAEWSAQPVQLAPQIGVERPIPPQMVPITPEQLKEDYEKILFLQAG